MANTLGGAIKYLAGFVFNKKGEQIEGQRDAWKAEADCGCGIDCCNKKVVMEDLSNGNTYELVVDGGVWKYRIHKSSDAYTSIATV